MHYSKLYPAQTNIVLDGESFPLKPFSLNQRIKIGDWFYPELETDDAIGSIENFLSGKDQVTWNHFNMICEYVFLSLEDPDNFLSPCNFKSKIKIISGVKKESDLSKTFPILNILIKAIDKNIADSLPIFSEKKLKKLSKQKSSKKPTDWTSIFVTIASETSYRLDTFYDLTMRQILGILEKINEQKYNESIRNLELHRFKVDREVSFNDDEDFEEKAMFDDDVDNALTLAATKDLEDMKNNKFV